MIDDPFRHPRLCALAGVSRLPEPLNWDAVREAIARERAASPGAARLAGPVLLSLSIDAAGIVTEAAAVDPPPHPGIEIRAVLVECDGRHTLLPDAPPAQPALRQVAVAAIRELRFRPAERDGAPVAFAEYRMTLEIGADDGAR